MMIKAASSSRATTPEVGIFDAILPDIGDHQSIENQLSTCIYRLGKMKHFLGVGPRSLAPAGTQGRTPNLAGRWRKCFRRTEKGCFGVVTTHYANIKPGPNARAFNGSMLFNSESSPPCTNWSGATWVVVHL